MLNYFIRNVKFRSQAFAFPGFKVSQHLLFGVAFLILKAFSLSVCLSGSANAESVSDTLSEEEKEILRMKIPELLQMDVVVTSPSKTPQKIKETASAIYVVTQEDIRRSGAVNLMEALRIAPGVQVSKINQNRYAISIRGFNRRLGSDKLLVLMDGRTLYSPSAAGVFFFF